MNSMRHGTTNLALHLGGLCNSHKSCNVHHYTSQQLDSVSTSFCILAIYIDDVYVHYLHVDNEYLYRSQNLPTWSSLWQRNFYLRAVTSKPSNDIETVPILLLVGDKCGTQCFDSPICRRMGLTLAVGHNTTLYISIARSKTIN